MCVSLGAPHMEKPVWGGARGLLLRACAEGRAVQWILCSPDARAWDRWGGHEVLCPLVPATQHGAGCGVLFVKESGAGVAGAGCDGRSARCGRRLRCSSVGNV